MTLNMIYKDEPSGFNSKFSVVSCYIESDGEILLLKRQMNKSEGGTWGLPAGKIEGDESEFEAMRREVEEETGLKIPLDQIQYIYRLFVRYRDYDFIYHSFILRLSDKPTIVISQQEHSDYRWVKPLESLSLPLIPDLDACIRDFYNLS